MRRGLGRRARGAAPLAAAGGDQDRRARHEWIKNVFVFAGLLFSGKFTHPHEILEATLAFVAFCLISSAGYFVNDLVDVELDRKHPKKRYRPLAAGELSERAAIDDRPDCWRRPRSVSPSARSTGKWA